jgi:hypothetical protein
MSEKAAALNKQERYKLRQLEFKEANKKSLCYVNLFSTITTVGLLIGTLVVLNIEPGSCTDSTLRLTLWLMIGMHATNILESVCGLTGLDHIFCGCCCVLAFFLYEVGVLIYTQSVLYSSPQCRESTETPKQYWWLLVNVVVYFFFVVIACFFHLRAFCGGPSQKEIDEEIAEKEKEEKKTNHIN